MKKSILACMVVAFVLFGTQTSHSQGASTQTQTVSMSVSSSDMIRIMNMTATGADAGATAVSLTLSGATEAGAAVSPIAADSSTRLRMSCFTKGTDKRKITAGITAGGNFASTKSKLELALRAPIAANLPHFINYASASTGVGTFVTLGDDDGNKAAGVLVSNMTTAWTGTNIGDGYEIYYKYSAYQGEVAQSVLPVTVTFTIGAN